MSVLKFASGIVCHALIFPMKCCGFITKHSLETMQAQGFLVMKDLYTHLSVTCPVWTGNKCKIPDHKTARLLVRTEQRSIALKVVWTWHNQPGSELQRAFISSVSEDLLLFCQVVKGYFDRFTISRNDQFCIIIFVSTKKKKEIRVTWY